MSASKRAPRNQEPDRELPDRELPDRELVAIVEAELKRARKPRAYNPQMLGRCAPTLISLVNDRSLESDTEGERARVVLETLAGLTDQLPAPERAAFQAVCLSNDRKNVTQRRASFDDSPSTVIRRENQAIAALAPWLVERLKHRRSDADRHRIIIVTAHNGTGLGQCIEKYLAYQQGIAEYPTRHIEVEGALRELLRTEGHFSAGPPRRSELFVLDQRTLRRAWGQALVSLVDEIREALTSGDVLLSFSATWYHEEGRSIFSPVALREFVDLSVGRVPDGERRDPVLEDAFKNAVVVTIIDDVYDCFARLCEYGKGELFDPTNFAESDRPLRSHLVRLLLEWRIAEVRAAEQLARVLSVRHHLMPAKQQLSDLAGVLAGTARVYLSHSMVQLRDNLPERQFIQHATAKLRAEPRVVVLEPATIDDHRLAEVRVDGRRAVNSTTLVDRWETYELLAAREDELLWSGLTVEQVPMAEQPFDYAPPDAPKVWARESPDTLDQLLTEVRSQVMWRYRRLMNDATEGYVTLRPFNRRQGRIRGLVVQEIALLRQLKKLEKDLEVSTGRVAPRRQDILFHPPFDERLRCAESIVQAFLMVDGSLPSLVRLRPAMGVSDEAARVALVEYASSKLRLLFDQLDNSQIDVAGLGAEFVNQIRALPEIVIEDEDGRPLDAGALTAAQPESVGREIVRCYRGQLGTKDRWSRQHFTVDAERISDLESADPEIKAERLVDRVVRLLQLPDHAASIAVNAQR